MAYESTDTVIYRPDGLDAVTLCKQGDLMAAPVDVTASVQVQRDGVLGSSWMLQRARGNALMQLSFTVAHPFPTCLLYTSPSPRDRSLSRMPSSA